MIIKKADLVAVTGRPDQYPPDDKKEIAFAGRSNVGKSSLLNLLTGRKKLAKVSSSPGKTRTINFYEINDAFRIVDLPGYGYAKVARSVSESWGKMMDAYFQHREGLCKVVLLVDIRHAPTRQDQQMYAYLKHYGLDGLVAATKADKISRGQIPARLSAIRKSLGMRREDDLLPVSALKKTGWQELLDAMDAVLGETL
ncbi:MAG: ribosome biogenesis GTP-binding protein YihA/YsxC [Eubacteriales bacterium]|jgi:GTP-binding protein|nr:ribosome biogenesis GTP-binding protein YihA/YsxC [Eubacteriales bacterium]